MAETKYSVNIPWATLQNYLTRLNKQLHSELVNASDPAEMYRFQGEIRRVAKLFNLPGTLTVLYDKEALTDGKAT